MYTALKSAFSLIYAHFDIEGVSRWSTVESLLLLGPRVAGLWLLRVWRLGCFGAKRGQWFAVYGDRVWQYLHAHFAARGECLEPSVTRNSGQTTHMSTWP